MKKFVVQEIPVAEIVVDRNIRTRLDERAQAELAESIRQNGILVPLLGHREGTSIVIDDGHRRLDGGVRAGRATVPMFVSERTPTPAERLCLILVVNTQRADLKVMEHARAIHELMTQTGWSAADVAGKLGRPSAPSISKLLALLVLPRDTQDLIDAGRLPMSCAYLIATVEDAAERQQLTEAVLSGNLTRDKLAAITKTRRAAHRSSKASRPRAARLRMNRIVFPVGPSRRVTVSAPELSVESVTEWVGDLLVALRQANAGGLALEHVSTLLSERGAS